MNFNLQMQEESLASLLRHARALKIWGVEIAARLTSAAVGDNENADLEDTLDWWDEVVDALESIVQSTTTLVELEPGGGRREIAFFQIKVSTTQVKSDIMDVDQQTIHYGIGDEIRIDLFDDLLEFEMELTRVGAFVIQE